jgi:hypothetical protein
VLDALAARLETEETLEGADLDAIVALVRPEVALFGGLLDTGDDVSPEVPLDEASDVSVQPL